MPFFEEPPPPPTPPVVPQREPWSGMAHDSVGVVVPVTVVLAKTEDVAVLVSGIVGFRSGFTLSVISIARRHDVLGIVGRFHMHHLEPGEALPSSVLRFGIRFSDGETVNNLHELRGIHALRQPRPGKYALSGGGGGGGGRKFTHSYWCSPLPPPGPLTLVCEWPKYDIPETRHDIDGGAIRDAGMQSEPLWPDDVVGGEPADPYQHLIEAARAAGGAASEADPET